MKKPVRLPARLACLAVLGACLLSCSTTPESSLFSLEPETVPATTDGPESIRIEVGPFSMPELVDHQYIVTRVSASAYTVHQNAGWNEPLGDAVHRVLTTNLDNRLNDVVAVSHADENEGEFDYRIGGEISRFDSDENGEVILIARWTIHDEKRNAYLSPRNVNYKDRANNPANSGQVARAMNRLLNEFSADIAEQLSQSLPETPSQNF